VFDLIQLCLQRSHGLQVQLGGHIAGSHQLGVFLDPGGKRSQGRLLLLEQDLQHKDGCTQTVTRAMTFIQQDDMTGLFTTQPQFAFRIALSGQSEQCIAHVFVSYWGLDQLKVVFCGVLV